MVDDLTRRWFLGGAAAIIAAPSAFASTPVARVITLEWTVAEIALSLGLSPVGCAEIGGYKAWVDVETARLSDSVDVGRRQQPSLEAIRRLHPDIILTSHYRHASIAQALGAIATTHLIDDQPKDGDMLASVYRSTRQVGEALSRPLDATNLLKRFDDDIENLRSRSASRISARKLVVAQPLPGVPRLRIFAPNAAICGILQRLGFAQAMDLPPQPFGFTTIDLEGLAALDGDSTLIILAEKLPDDLAQSPLWPLLPVVRSGHVRLTGAPSWPFGSCASLTRLMTTITNQFN